MSEHGKIVSWNDAKGFGFIAPSSGIDQVFVHIKAFPRGVGRPQVGEEVTYDVIRDDQGRSRAANARLARRQRSVGPAVEAFFVGGLFLAFVAALAALHRIPYVVLWLYLGMSALSLGLYALDKSAARSGGQRTPESRLHLLSLLGGWPGAILAQQLLRHKSSKASFRTGFWFTVIVNIAALGFLLSPYGAPCLRMLDRLAAGVSIDSVL